MALTDLRGRRARRVVYPLLGLPLVAAIVLLVYLRSGHPEALLRDRLHEALSRTLGRPVSIARIDLEYLPPGVTVVGFRTEGPLIEAARVEASFSLRALLRGRIVIRDVDLYDPVLQWDTDAGRLVPKREPAARPPGRVASRMSLRRLRIHRGQIVVGSSRRSIGAEVEGLSLTADNLNAAPGPAGIRGPWEGSLYFTRGRFTLDNLVIDSLAGSVSVAFEDGVARARKLRLKAEEVDVRGAGMVRPGSPPIGQFDFTALLLPGSSAISRPLHQFDARQLTADVRVAMTDAGVAVTGTFVAEDPTIDPDRQEGSDGPAPMWSARRGAGTFSVGAGRIEIDGALEAFSGGSLEGRYLGVKEGDTRDHQVQLAARGLRLEEVLRHYDLVGDDRVAPSALMEGSASVRWRGSDTDGMAGRADLTFRPAPGDLPVSGVASISWLGRRVTIESSSLQSEGARAEIAGRVDFSSSPTGLNLAGTLFCSDSAPLSAFLERRFGKIPGDPRGRLGGRFEMTGTTALPEISGTFEASGLQVTLPALGRSAAGGVPATLSAASGRFAYRPDLLTLEASRATAEGLDLRTTVRVDPRRGQILGLDLDAAPVPADLLCRLAGLDAGALGAEGAAKLSAKLAAGTRGTGGPGPLEGPIELSAAGATMAGVSLSEVKARARLEPGLLRLDEASFSLLGGSVRADGAVRLGGGQGDGPGGVVDVRATGIDLAAIDAAFAGPSMAGLAQAEGRISLDGAGSIEATLSGTGIRVAGIDLGQVSGSMSGTLDRVRFGLSEVSSRLAADGVFTRADAQSPIEIEAVVKARGISLEHLRPALPRGALGGLKGDADGVFTVRGALLDPSGMKVHAQLDRISLIAGDYPLRNDGPINLTVEYGFVTLSPMRLVGEKTDLTLGGSMQLSGSRDITARVQGSYDLGLVELLAPELKAAGPGTADLGVIQRGDTLTYSGTLTLDGATLSHPSLPMPLTGLGGRAQFTEQGELRIQEAGFDVGGGHVVATGWARFEGAGMPGLHLVMKGRGIRAELIPDLRAFFDADATLDRDGVDFRLGGTVTVQRAVYSRPFGVAPSELLLRSREYAPSLAHRPGGVQVFLDLDIVADGDVWVRNDDALIEASARLSLEGTVGRPELSGRILALEGGSYRFRDVTYQIVGGAVDFTELTRVDPEIDITAATRVQQYEVTLHITGRFSKPVFELSADPPLPQRDIVWLLLTGATLSDSPNPEIANNMAEGQVAAYLAAPVAGAVTDPLERILGVSSMQIDPYFLNGAADPSTRLTVTKRLENNLLFTYSSSLGQSGQEVYQVQYNPGRWWYTLATRDLDGSIGADFWFRRRWKGLIHQPPFLAIPLSGPQLPETVDTAERHRIGRISIVADHLVDTERALIGKLPFDQNDPFRRGDLLEGREALRRQYVRHGYAAATVEVVEEEPDPLAPGLHPVRYVIRAGPRHSLKIEGETRAEPIRDAVRDAWMEPILLEDLVSEARAAALHMLQVKGFYTAKVDAGLEAPEPDRRVVRLEVEPGPKVRVRSILISGNTAMTSDRIRRQMLTHEDSWINVFNRGLLRDDILRDDLNAIRSLYRANGYLGAEVAPPDISFSPDGRQADVALLVKEGPQSRIEAVSIEGETAGVPAEDLLKAAGLSPTQIVSPQGMEQAADRMREELDKNGYSRARVTYRLEGAPDRTHVIFSIVAFDRARVAKVIIEGNTRTHSAIVKREIRVKEGEYLSRAAMLSTQRNLYRLGVFRAVQVESTPAQDRPGQVNVRVRLEEGQPLMTAWGVGYDTEDKARASFEVANNNLFGTRRSAALFFRGSGVDRRIQLTLRDPNLFGERIDTLLSGFHERQDTDSYDLRRYGAGMQISRKFGKHTTLFGGYLLEDVKLFNLKVSFSEIGLQTARLGSVGTSIAFDSRDDIVSPTRGWVWSADTRLYGPAFGSELGVGRFYASAATFRDIGRGVVWAGSVRGGRLMQTRDPLSDVPISTRFFAGGDTTLRGFEFNSVGPLDAVTGEALGGNAVFLLNQELRFPIFSALKGVVFYDLGNVWGESGGSLNFGDFPNMRHDVGAGLRFDTPVGPFRVEYGWKLDRRRGESPGQFFFSIGQAF